MNTAAIQTQVANDGRTLYTVAGMVSTYVEQEAHELTAEGVYAVLCPLTRSIMESPTLVRRELEPAPACTGTLEKFPWSK